MSLSLVPHFFLPASQLPQREALWPFIYFLRPCRVSEVDASPAHLVSTGNVYEFPG